MNSEFFSKFLRSPTFRWAGIGAIVLLFFVGMVIAPWIRGDGSWRYVQEVWDRWQTFNAAMVAFIASLIGFQISKSRADDQRNREFVAARAFLPHALSELCTYFEKCAELLLGAHQRYTALLKESHLAALDGSLPAPPLPPEALTVFKECIKLGEPGVSVYLTDLLKGLQVIDARVSDLWQGPNSQNSSVTPIGQIDFIEDGMSRLVVLQMKVNTLFDFVRGDETFKVKPTTPEDVRNACAKFGFKRKLPPDSMDALCRKIEKHLKNPDAT